MYLVRVDKESDKRYEVLYYEEYHGSYDKDDGFLKRFGYTPASIYGNDTFSYFLSPFINILYVSAVVLLV